MTDFIQGDKFIKLADFTFAPQKRRNDDYDNLPNTFDVSKLKDKNIIYTHTIYAKELFSTIKELQCRFVIVSHNGDVNIDFTPPDNVIKWYSQNVNIIHDKVESIPIGLENDRWFRDTHKKEKMSAKLKEKRVYKNIVYMNHNISTNPAKRHEPYRVLEGKSWVTSERGSNGHRFDEYLDNIYNHHFVVCPEGNGIDTHRIWEALYMGSIPIVENNINNSFYYEKLPMLPINEWSSLSKDFLAWWCSVKEDWDYNLLTFEYWKNKILNT